MRYDRKLVRAIHMISHIYIEERINQRPLYCLVFLS